MKIAGISGSLRQHSINTGILRAVKKIAADKGAEFTLVDISEIPLYNQDVNEQGIPASVQKAHDEIAAADAIVLACPEYNYSVSGVLKNAIDWFSRVENQGFNGKAVSIMGASPGLGTSRMQYDLRKILIFLNAFVVNKPEVLIGGSGGKFDDEGNLTDEKTIEFLGKAVDALIELSKQLNK